MTPPHKPFPIDLLETIRSALGEVSDEQPYPRDLSLNIDGKLGNLDTIYNEFGLLGIKAIMLGLSRPFNATAKDVEELIGDWELRDKKCCYGGSVQDLLGRTDTMILAISYRHAEETEWNRKGENRVCKFRPRDEVLLASAVEAFRGDCPSLKVMVWCDQILKTRCEDLRLTGFSWHHIGLLPYMAFRLLNLSTHIQEEELEERIWIRAERSLGRMANGFFKANEVSKNMLTPHLGNGASGWTCMKNLAKHILSGYWPPDLNHWKKAYDAMKKWALGVVFRGGRQYFSIPLFQAHEDDAIDNIEIMSNIGELAVIPVHMDDVEPVVSTTDDYFFLKVTAWNLSVRSIWEDKPNYISHYMGRGNAQFSWWQCKQRNVLFGFLVCGAHATTIIAVHSENGYRVLKGRGNISLYVHAERVAGIKTREQIFEAGQKAGVALSQDLEWVLLYCFDATDMNDICTSSEIVNVLQQQTSTLEQAADATVTVPPVFRASTTNIFKCAVAKCGGNATEVARRICECVADWNEYVTRDYPEWTSVKDTSVGPVWLEGFDEEKVSFGFLEFLTEAVLINRRCIPGNVVKMADSGDVTKQLSTLLPIMKSDEQCLTQELVKGVDDTENNCKSELSRRDVAHFILCGGFGKDFLPDGKTAFLRTLALTKGYWATMVVCRNGVMQIRFCDARGEKRIAQRKTKLENYSGRGVVNPNDYDQVREMSVEYDTSDDKHSFMTYWNDEMEDTTTREEMWCSLRNSRRSHKEKEISNPEICNEKEILLADMTVGETEEDRLLGDGNIFAYGLDPFIMLEIARSGQAAIFFKGAEAIEAAYSARFAEAMSDIRSEMNHVRNLGRKRAKDLDE